MFTFVRRFFFPKLLKNSQKVFPEVFCPKVFGFNVLEFALVDLNFFGVLEFVFINFNFFFVFLDLFSLTLICVTGVGHRKPASQLYGAYFQQDI